MDQNEELRGLPMPCSMEAEISVLGAMLQDSSAVLRASEQLKTEDFYAAEHQEIYSAMTALNQNRSPIDLITVHAELSRRGSLEGVGGDAYLLRLISQVPTTANVRAYIDIVLEKSTLRKLILACQEISRDCYTQQKPVPDTLAGAEKAIFDIVMNRTDGEALKPLRDVLVNTYEEIEELSKLKGEIKALGPVNLNSVDEYKEISERFEFMTSQRNDIAQAKANLEKVISDLIQEMKQQFIEHFNIINENFKTVFTDLFNGGTAEILLGDEEDVLNCSIEIKAQPPGKRLQNLTLLSGGERCLTAIALLFAIQQLKPSPFVVLDEVEAALDDVNVTRFTDFVRRYTAKTQFIIVTHRKGTMEACDRMYGVTMQERGISKILSMRLGDSI